MGFLFLILYPGFSSSLPPPASRLPPPPPHITTQSFITHPLSHTLFDTQSFTHTIFHTPSLTSSFTYHLSHTIFYTHHLSLTIFVTHLCQSLSHTHIFVNHHCVAGVALGDMCLHFTWQAWHLATCAFISRGRRGTYGTGLALVARSFTHHIFHSPPIFVNLSHTSLSTTIAPTSLCGVLVFDSVSRALLLQPPASRLRRLITQHNLSSHTLFHTPSLTHNLSHTIFHLSNNFVTYHRSHTQLCHTQSSTHPLSHNVSHTIFHTPSLTSSFTYQFSHSIFYTQHLSLTIFVTHLCQSLTHIFVNHHCVAGLALGDMCLRFTWQAWNLWHWAGSGGALGLGLVAGDAAALCVAGVALGNIHLRFTWQAWHLWHWAGSGGALGLGLVASDCVAGVALGDMHLHFVWQARHLVTSTFVLRGRRGTW